MGELPDFVDWRKHGLVTDVMDQGLCGSCYAFSGVGALEGQHMRATGNLVQLSVQNIVDCSYKYGNRGCFGGLPDFVSRTTIAVPHVNFQVYAYVKGNKGIDTAISYPYVVKNGSLPYPPRKCFFNPDSIGATLIGYIDLPTGNENDLKTAVATQGPISVGVDAAKSSFLHYQGGIYFEKDCDSVNLNHGMLVVGYGSDPVHGDYWIVKNSFGTDWGEQGYIRMARNRDNNCGIATKASYPLI